MSPEDPSCRDWTGMSRRTIAGIAILVALIGLAIAAWSHRAATPAGPVANTQGEPFDPRLGSPFALRERPSLGSDKAPIVVIEFFSPECQHCRFFFERIFPDLRAQYVDTGKVQWFVVNATANPADKEDRIFTIARCADRRGRFWGALGSLFKLAGGPREELDRWIADNADLFPGGSNACLGDAAIQKEVAADFAEYGEARVRTTPTFLVRRLRGDGRKIEARIDGNQAPDYFQRVFDGLLKEP